MGLLFQNSNKQLFTNKVFGDIAFGPKNINFSEDKEKRSLKTYGHFSFYQECLLLNYPKYGNPSY